MRGRDRRWRNPKKNISVSPGGRRLRGDDIVRDGAALRRAVACCCRNVDSPFAHLAGGSRLCLVLLFPSRSPSSLEGSWVQLVLSPPPRSPTAQEGSRVWLVFVPPPFALLAGELAGVARVVAPALRTVSIGRIVF